MIAVTIIRSEKYSWWLQLSQTQINLEKINENGTFDRSLVWYVQCYSYSDRKYSTYNSILIHYVLSSARQTIHEILSELPDLP